MTFQPQEQYVENTTSNNNNDNNGWSHRHRGLGFIVAERENTNITEAHEDWMWDLFTMEDGTYASSSYDRSVKLWSPSGQLLAVYNGNEPRPPKLLLSEWNKHLLFCNSDRVILWNVGTNQIYSFFTRVQPNCVLALSTKTTYNGNDNDGRLLVGFVDGTLELWKVSLTRAQELGSVSSTSSTSSSSSITTTTMKVLKSFAEYIGLVECLLELTDGTFLSGASDYKIKRWKIEGDDSRCIQTFSYHVGSIIKMVVVEGHDGGGDKKTMASCARDEYVVIWELETAMPLRVFVHESSTVQGLIALGDHKLLTTARDAALNLWDTRTGEHLSLVYVDGEINCATLSRDHSQLVIGVRRCLDSKGAVWRSDIEFRTIWNRYEDDRT